MYRQQQSRQKQSRQRIINLIVAILVSGAFFFFSPGAQAIPGEKSAVLNINPYSYLPRSIRRLGSQAQRMKKPLLNAAPQNPAIVTDRYGNKTIYQKGKQRLAINRDGTETYYANNQKSFQKVDGKLTRRFEYHGAETTILNEWGDVLGYEKYGLGGKLLDGYNANHNLTSRREYDGRGYWQIDETTNVWKRYELDAPAEERRGGKDGPLIAYWKQENGSLWRIEMTADEQGNAVEGNKTRYDRFGIEYYETFANDGTKVRSFKWENHRLKYEIDQTNHFKKYNLFGVEEEGFLSQAGVEYAEWIHTWEGTRHLSARNPYTNEVRYYDANGNIDKLTVVITQKDVDRDKAKADDDPYKIGWSDDNVGKEYLLDDYIYFYEVKDLSASQLQALLGTTDKIAALIYQRIGELKAEGKADAGLAFVATYNFTYAPSDGEALYMAKLSFYDVNNLFHFTLSGEDPTAPQGFSLTASPFSTRLLARAREALEQNDPVVALIYTNRIIELQLEQAKQEQNSLSGLPGEDAHRYAALNMVGLALSIQGDAYLLEGKIEQAKAAYNRVVNEFGFSQQKDSQTGLWKSLKEEVQLKLNRLS